MVTNVIILKNLIISFSGIKILDNYILSTGPDQRLSIWNVQTGNELSMKHLDSYFLDVADTSSLDAQFVDDSKK